MMAALSESKRDHLKIITFIHDSAASIYEEIRFVYRDMHAFTFLKNF